MASTRDNKAHPAQGALSYALMKLQHELNSFDMKLVSNADPKVSVHVKVYNTQRRAFSGFDVEVLVHIEGQSRTLRKTMPNNRDFTRVAKALLNIDPINAANPHNILPIMSYKAEYIHSNYERSYSDHVYGATISILGDTVVTLQEICDSLSPSKMSNSTNPFQKVLARYRSELLEQARKGSENSIKKEKLRVLKFSLEKSGKSEASIAKAVNAKEKSLDSKLKKGMGSNTTRSSMKAKESEGKVMRFLRTGARVLLSSSHPRHAM